MASLRVNDVVERTAGKPTPMPEADGGAAFDSPATGFPAHKRRLRMSKFKQNQQLARANGSVPNDEVEAPAPATAKTSNQKKKVQFGPDTPSQTPAVSERERIDRENSERIASMSPAEIEQARRELMEDLNPRLLHKLMMRANLDEKHGPSPFDVPITQPAPISDSKPDTSKTAPRTVQIEDVDEPPSLSQANTNQSIEKDKAVPKKPLPRNLDPNTHFDEDAPPTNPPDDLLAMADVPVKPHFPVPHIPDLDPNDPDFLETLRQKYFPETPSDPTKLAWMAPLPTKDSPADRESPYHPGQSSISTSALRFDFRGKLLPPSLSRVIPVSKGLHHHGLAPEAAGYTIEELSIYARSAVAAQRCIAFQTLGRILFRLGHGDWGTGIEDPIAMGIWNSVKEGRVLDSLSNAAMQTSGHRGSQAYATEALWLFEKGGWKEKTRGR